MKRGKLSRTKNTFKEINERKNYAMGRPIGLYQSLVPRIIDPLFSFDFETIILPCLTFDLRFSDFQISFDNFSILSSSTLSFHRTNATCTDYANLAKWAAFNVT